MFHYLMVIINVLSHPKPWVRQTEDFWEGKRWRDPSKRIGRSSVTDPVSILKLCPVHTDKKV